MYQSLQLLEILSSLQTLDLSPTLAGRLGCSYWPIYHPYVEVTFYWAEENTDSFSHR